MVIVAVGLAAYWFFDRQESGPSGNDNDGFSIGDLFPFGTSPTPTPPPSTDLPSTPTPPATPSTPPQIWKISNDPQSGAVVFLSSTTPTVRYIDKATGNVFESSLHTTGVKRISNTTIPKIYEAFWQSKGDGVVLRYINESNVIQTLFAKLTSTSTPTENNETLLEIQGTFLPTQILNASVHSSGKIAYLVEKTDGGSALYITDSAAKNPKLVFESAVRDWNTAWVKDDTVSLNTKPSANIPGYLYFVKTNSVASRIIGGQKGLTSLVSPSGSKVIYSENINGNSVLNVHNIESGSSEFIPLITLSEKCVWSKKNSNLIYCAVPKVLVGTKNPDDWYQGRVSFDDSIWQFDTDTFSTKLIIDPSKLVGESIDAINLQLDPDERYLIFTNKKDSQLWGLKLVKES